MAGSRTIRVRKRDVTLEPLDVGKLAACLLRAMGPRRGGRPDALALADAIHIHLRRCGARRVASAAVFEMAVCVLRRVRMGGAADRLEVHGRRRAARRRHLRIRHDGGVVTRWDKGWLRQVAARKWDLRPATAAVLARDTEDLLLGRGGGVVERADVLEVLEHCAAGYGLTPPVPA